MNEVQRFLAWRRSLRAVPTIVFLRRKIEAARRREIAKTLRCFLHVSKSERESIEALTGANVTKILHSPLTRLELLSGDQAYLAVTTDLFALDEQSAAVRERERAA